MVGVDEEKKTVDIDQAELYNLASVMGLMTRAFKDWDETIFEQKHEISIPALMVAVFLLDRKLGGEFFKIAWASFLDVASSRRILPDTPKQVVWPAWDEESLAHPEVMPIYDICLMLSAWNLAAKQDDLPPEMFLGPLFSLSGVIVEGVDRGFYLSDEKSRKLYEEQRKSLASSHGSEEEFKAALKAQLSSIAEAYNGRKESLQKKA